MKLRFSNEMDKNIPKDIICLTLINCTVHYPKGCYAHKSELMLVTAGHCWVRKEDQKRTEFLAAVELKVISRFSGNSEHNYLECYICIILK